MQWWFDWKKFGCFPHPGDFLDQPVTVCEVLWLCEATDATVKKEQAERARAND